MRARSTALRMMSVLPAAALAVIVVGTATIPAILAAPGDEVPNAADGVTAVTGWSTTGNAAASGAYLGTRNRRPLVFKTYRRERMRISPNGNIGIGTTSPDARLEVANGRIRLSSNNGDVEFTQIADLLARIGDASPVATDPALRLHTGTGLTRLLTVLNNGNMGIGDPTPGGRLIVRGDGQTFLLRVQSQSGADALKVTNNGVVAFGALYSLSSTNHLCYHAPLNLALTTCSSAAEYVPTIDRGNGLPEAADLVSIVPDTGNPDGDEHAPFTVQRATTPCDTNLVGFIVDPASGADGKKLNERYLPLAIYGYFPAKVTTENGPVKRGDPLTSSSKAGYAMKSTGGCRVIGYALEDAPADATIQVFAHLGDDSASEVAKLRARLDEMTTENQELRQQLSSIEQRLAALEAGSADDLGSTRHGPRGSTTNGRARI